ncbi:type II toxin-antitoxin system RelE/ParE family toxin [Parabacteroides goldsteinii]|uniref:type II toxin-antitoxin system RelE/ParE family toxin n=1 Tax=uncultured Parabacteroides sp. TaxID=512312 RepID=UPI00101D0C5D|nr:type II toxin-antitoxin system RelE/ParE family toxin [Parabacteroides goldsteinii]
MKTIRNLLFYNNCTWDFIKQQSVPMQYKIGYVLDLLCYAQYIPKNFFKHIEGTKGLYEIRIEAESNIIRIFCCFDEGQLIVLFNGFQKKSRKTPAREIQKALSLMKEYFESKNL